MNGVINAGEFRHRITIFATETVKDKDGFQHKNKVIVLQPYASIKTTRGFTIIKNNSDFEKAYTNFTIRYPRIPLNRDMLLDYNGKTYEIVYISNVDEANTFIELQCKEVTH